SAEKDRHQRRPEAHGGENDRRCLPHLMGKVAPCVAAGPDGGCRDLRLPRGTYTQHPSRPQPAIGARLLKTDTSEHLKPRSQYADDAVQLAIQGKWDEAVKLNKFIIDSFGADEETQNRLGKALSELGKLKDAKAAYEGALKLNPMNSIAKKNAARINALLHQKEGLKVGGTRVDLNLFVEEMGKTVITTVESATNADISSKVAVGDVEGMKSEAAGIIAETSSGVRVGQLEPKIDCR